MEFPIAVEEILEHVPERARIAYTYLVTSAKSEYDQETGWSCAYITQQALADEMYVCLRTTTRAIRDLKDAGLVRVLSWPGARTETQVRIDDIDVSSPFGPINADQERQPRHVLVQQAIAQLLAHNRELEALAAGM
ncbi:hypothetical protein ACFQ61_08375 [Streptomyces sp. NPDC056500]|uniref:hypothetical protein n=1 Tax=Streptomyces sp. NPDC056500 TaxID=3345840 RepID=UPI00369CBF9B